MPLQIARPDVADMILRTFQRPIHPELFDSLKQCKIRFGDKTAEFRLGATGHLIEFRMSPAVITETAITKHETLPESMKVVERRLIGYRTHMVDTPGVRYHCSYQLEHVPLDVYLQLHREMEMDSRNATLAISVPGTTPQSPDSISLITCDVMSEGLVVHTYHSFPENAAILKTQTLFEVLE